VYFDVFGDSEVFEAVLQDFEVVDEVYFEVGLPFDLLKGHFPGVGSIQELAVDASRPELFDGGERGAENVVDPVHNVVPRSEIATFLHSR
jgi:hypothetical protein